jgi:hypothetical protein
MRDGIQAIVKQAVWRVTRKRIGNAGDRTPGATSILIDITAAVGRACGWRN